MSSNRRGEFRVPESRLITEIATEMPYVSSIVNVSNNGLYTMKPVTSGRLGPRIIQLEIPVPEASESLWATGEIVFETESPTGVGTGIRIKQMPNCHRSLLADMVEDRRKWFLKSMLKEILWRKQLAKSPNPYMAPPPPARQKTVRMFYTS